MGCVLACFRIKDDDRKKDRALTRLIALKIWGFFVPKKRPLPLPKSEDPPLIADRVGRKLIHEANFPKVSTAIRETPTDIQKGVEKKLLSVFDEQNNNQTCSEVKPPGSPYPTPLKLTDDMETPQTVHLTNREIIEARANARVRTEYVYRVSDPADNLSLWKLIRKEDESNRVDHSRSSSCVRETLCSIQHLSPALSCKGSPNLSTLDSREQHFLKPGCLAGTDSSLMPLSAVVETPAGNLHLKYQQIASDRRCLWDGNGIPNTTSKYKEDQKVHWHATPFEKRLQKVLSDGKTFPQIGLEVDEKESNNVRS